MLTANVQVAAPRAAAASPRRRCCAARAGAPRPASEPSWPGASAAQSLLSVAAAVAVLLQAEGAGAAPPPPKPAPFVVGKAIQQAARPAAPAKQAPAVVAAPGKAPALTLKARPGWGPQRRG